MAVAPLAKAQRGLPDVIVVEGPPEALMWLALADLNRAGGARRHGDTAVLQATCVDAVVVPHLEQRLNFSLGCYGCREATDLGRDETVLGFPAAHLDALVDALESKLAGPQSRAHARRRPYQQFMKGPRNTARAGHPGPRCFHSTVTTRNSRMPDMADSLPFADRI